MLREYLYPAAFAVMAAGGIWALARSKNPKAATIGGCAAQLLGAALASGGVICNLNSDPLWVFQLPILILGAAGAVHSTGYLRGHGEERSGIYWFFYNLTVAAMLGVTLCDNPIMFLVVWELMGLCSYALVAFDFRSRVTARAAWIYLLACQAGSLFLIPMFLFPGSPELTFTLALLGFGLKVGFPLLHVWLPEAHPAAPAPVSALMSGAMIQLGFFGILRWGSVDVSPVVGGISLLTLGVTGALGGILFALPRTNLKTLLAYSSIENMGIIGIALGLSFLGVAAKVESVTICAVFGAELHMLNHALLKGGLFLGAGTVQKAVGTLEMEKMGGLLKRMHLTGTLFLLNSAGLSGVPPFNAFVSEFLIYLAALGALISGNTMLMIAGVVALLALALTGGLAGAVFCKAAGAVFLGEPRTEKAAAAVEAPRSMTFPVALLFLAGSLLTLATPWLLVHGESVVFPAHPELLRSVIAVVTVSLGATLLFAVLCFVRFRMLPRGRHTRNAPTWGCGYTAPDARMEYTGTAFVQPLTEFFRALLRIERKIKPPEGDFPQQSSYSERAFDPGLAGFWEKLFNSAARTAEKSHVLQSGFLHLYILIVTLALIAMLIWGLILPWSGSLMKGGFGL